MEVFRSELYKTLHKRGYYGCFGLTIVWSLLMIIVFHTTAKGRGIAYDASVWAPMSADLLATYLVWLMVAFAYVIVSSDYVEKTVSNLIIAGADRKKIYISKLIIFTVSCIIAVLISCALITVVSGIAFGWGNWDSAYTKEFFGIVLRLVIFVLQFVAYFSILCSIFNNQAATLITSFLTLTALSVIVQIIKIIFKTVKGIEEYSPCASGNIIKSYGDKYINGWMAVCLGCFLVFSILGVFISSKREL